MSTLRTCPSCQRRYAGLVATDCPVCDGLGVIPLGPPALHTHTPAAVARAIELYLETTAHTATQALPLPERLDTVRAAVLELRTAGLIDHLPHTGTPANTRTDHPTQTHDTTETDAHTLANADPHAATRLAAPPIPLTQATNLRAGIPPRASRNGHPSTLATITDPIHPDGPDTTRLTLDDHATNHQARILTLATPDAARRRAARPGRTP